MALAKVFPGPAGKLELHVLGAAEVPAQGISRGVVSSIEDAVASVSSCVDQLERMTGMPVEKVWVGVSVARILTQASKGVVAVSRTDGEIREEDVERAIEAAKTVATPLNYEIIHVIPKSFSVDGQAGIKDPVGMTGIRLEVESQLVHALSSQVRNLTKCVYRTGLDIEELVLSILACAETVSRERQKELGVAVVNIGGATTSLAVFEEGDVLGTALIPIGGEHVTSDIAIGLRTSIDVAERVKVDYGSALPETLNKKEEVNLADLGAPDEEWVSQKYVAQIVEARVEEIFERVDKELKTLGKSGMLPAGVILTGGGAKIAGIVEVAKRKLRLPATLGYPTNMASLIDRANDLTFTTALGLVVWGAHASASGSGRGLLIPQMKSLRGAASGLKKLFSLFRRR
jgi:cell division protein FtsA